MAGNNQESERLKRLRERQLADRDPLVEQRQFQRSSAQRERRLSKKSYSFGRMWNDVPHAWRGFFYGVVLGTVVLIILPLFWLSPWAVPCSTATIVVFAIVGVIIGRAIDTRENIKDLIK
jgi:hypothetical protein